MVCLAPGCRTVLVATQTFRLFSTRKGLRESRATAGRGVGTELTAPAPVVKVPVALSNGDLKNSGSKDFQQSCHSLETAQGERVA